ncbi:MAG TPA: hydroxyacid dehydrogenase, partial [Xanthobacteraceae bacterium]|nr:hydroxyacid dehydrogenase [Xanthobacteraceae bacterium]
MPDIVITESIDEDALKSVLAGFDVHYDPKLFLRHNDLCKAVADIPALIVRNNTQVNAEVIESAKKLKVVGRLGVGLDNIDMQACKTRGIAVYPATGANTQSVVEYVLGAAFVLLRRAFFATPEVIAGEFPRAKWQGREVTGKRLGIVGFGAIGRALAASAAALGMEVVGYDPNLKPNDPAWSQNKVVSVDFDTLLATSDVVSLHVPLTAQTKNLIDRAALLKMKRNSILINAARGGVANEEALVEALRSGQLGSAALDVFTEEPLSKEKAQIFADCPNLILTPHVGAGTAEANRRVSFMVA